MDVLLAPYMKDVYGAGQLKTQNIGNWMSPLKLFEYMSYKKPIICTDIDVLHDIISDGINGIFCEADKTEQWVDAIKRLNEDKKLYKQLAENGYNDLVNKYTWSIRANEVLR